MAQTVGFDIGGRQMKVAWFSGKTLKGTAAVDMPDNMTSGGEILSMDAMADFIKESAKQNGIPKGNASVIIPGSLVYVRRVTLPVMNETQLKYNLPFEFKDYLTEEKNKYYFDYAVYGIINDEEGNPSEMDLFACAILKSTVDEYRRMFRRAGYMLKCIIPEEYAFSVLVREAAAHGINEEDSTCILDIGHNEMRMHILHGDKVENRRTIDRGILDLDQIIADEYNVDIHVAHSYKLRDHEDALRTEHARELYNSMAIEIMKTINFYKYSNRDTDLEKIYLMGGGSAIEGLREAISETTGMKVCPVSELYSYLSGENNAGLFAKAYGCAMSL